MIYRLILICLLAAGVSAESIIDVFPAGKTQKLSYEIFVPEVNQTNSLEIEITRSKGSDPIFTIYQAIDIPSQKITLKSTEKYKGAELALISSENIIKLPPEAKRIQGTDSIAVHAIREKDSIIVSSNVPKMIPDSRIPADNNFITSVGSMLSSRTIEFKPGVTRTFSYSNFLLITGQPFSANVIIDSVIGLEKVIVPAGEFECYKVQSKSSGMTTFTYFSNDKNRIPVKTEVMDPTGEKSALVIKLKKIE